MKRDKLLRRILAKSENVRFGDFVTLVESFGFRLARVTGSHHIYKRPDTGDLLNIQNYQGKAKPYQIQQFLRRIGESFEQEENQ
jgi:predicted RNA binding protein YcfA (HicA-like mRNA interferase family)